MDNMKEFTKEMLEKLHAANDAVKGTDDYTKYGMTCEHKYSGGRWKFLRYSIPYRTGTFKTVKGKTYIMIETMYDVERFAVTEAVAELLGI